jgi:hypothetical protein
VDAGGSALAAGRRSLMTEGAKVGRVLISVNLDIGRSNARWGQTFLAVASSEQTCFITATADSKRRRFEGQTWPKSARWNLPGSIDNSLNF